MSTMLLNIYKDNAEDLVGIHPSPTVHNVSFDEGDYAHFGSTGLFSSNWIDFNDSYNWRPNNLTLTVDFNFFIDRELTNFQNSHIFIVRGSRGYFSCFLQNEGPDDYIIIEINNTPFGDSVSYKFPGKIVPKKVYTVFCIFGDVVGTVGYMRLIVDGIVNSTAYFGNSWPSDLNGRLIIGAWSSIENSISGYPLRGGMYYFRYRNSIEYDDPPSITNIVCGTVGVVTSSVSSLAHLEGQTVAILADGEVLDQQIVTGGAITLPASYSQLHVGLPFISDLETVNIEVPLEDGTAQGKKVKIGNVAFRVMNTRGGWVGPNENLLYEAFNDAIITKLESSDPKLLLTDDIRVPLGAGYEGGGRLFFRNYDPTPVTINAVIPEVNFGGVAS